MKADVSVLRGGGFRFGAHHPHCERHAHHLLWIGRHPLCLGCACMALGLPLGAAGALLAGTDEVTAAWAAIHVGLIAPTALQPFLQLKPFKMFARTAVGAATGSIAVFCAGVLRPPDPAWLAVCALLGTFIALARALLWLRSRFPDDPCQGCPLGVFPVCSWNAPRLVEGAEPLLRDALAQGRVEVRGE